MVTLELCPVCDIYGEPQNLFEDFRSRKIFFGDRYIQLNVTPNVTLVKFSVCEIDYGS